MGGSAHNSAPTLPDKQPMQGRTASTAAERDRREGATGRRAAAPVTPLEGESLPPRAGLCRWRGGGDSSGTGPERGPERTGTARAEPPGKALPPGTAAGAGTASPRCGTPQPYGAAPSAPANGRRARPEPPPAPLPWEAAAAHQARWKVCPHGTAATSRWLSKKSEQMVQCARMGMASGSGPGPGPEPGPGPGQGHRAAPCDSNPAARLPHPARSGSDLTRRALGPALRL